MGFVVSQAIRDVYLGHLFGDLGLYEVATLAFGTAAGVFGLGLLVFKRSQLGLIAAHLSTIAALNLTTAISWLSYFQALRMIEPAAVNLAFCGVGPIAVAALGVVGLSSQGESRPGRTERWVHAGMLGTVGLVAIAAGGVNGLAGVALAALAGFSITAESVYAKRANLAGLSPVAIVGVRFLMVTLIAGSLLTTVAQPYAGLSSVDLAWQAGVFLLILIGPIYLVQAGIALTSPLISGVICSLGPIATLVLQWTAGGIAFSSAMLWVTLLYAALSVVAALLATKVLFSDAGDVS